jgi:uncharacterized membrane protein YkoI
MREARTVRRIAALASLAIVLLAGATAAYAEELEELPDYEQAREAVGRGQAIPLAQILDLVADKIDGEIVGIELEREGTALIYELKVIKQGGRLTVVYVDAASGKILENGNVDHAGSDR